MEANPLKERHPSNNSTDANSRNLRPLINYSSALRSSEQKPERRTGEINGGGTKGRGPVDESSKATACAPLVHPLRVRILEVANTRDVSPVQFVNEQLAPLGVRFDSKQHALSRVSYHFRELEKAGCVEVVKRVPRRGATEKIYRGTTTVEFTDEEFEKLPLEQREMMSRTSFQGLIARTDNAMRAGTFDGRTDRWLVWVPGAVDAQGWEEVTAAMATAYVEVKASLKAARDRLDEAGEAGMPMTFGMLGFESPLPPPPPPAVTPDEPA
jgi:hypothetical protein